MTVLPFAWRSLVRQPARATLGIVGVAAVGALLFDMLLLSEGLIVSMRDLLERTGYDVRVTTTADLPRTSPSMEGATAAVAAIRRLPAVRATLAIRFADVIIDRADGEPLTAAFQGVSGGPPPWTVLRGRDVQGAEIVVNDTLARAMHLQPGAEVTIRPSCETDIRALPPVRLRVAGVAVFPFELTAEHSIGGRLETLDAACGDNDADRADMILVTSTGDPDAAAASIRQLRPDLSAATNQQMLGRIQQGGFTYFRQISTVLTTVTVAFALLLITVLLTVSVNQRLGEIAALRALGFSRRRVVADVLCESALIVGIGGLLSLPLGLVLASWLDRILKAMPNIPIDVHFFVFEPGALGVHLALLVLTALVAALYPMRIVARLPIAATLRNEVIQVNDTAIVEASHVTREFRMPAGPVTAVRDVSLRIGSGEHVAVRGPSGCGKSTLLHMLGCVETPTSGTLLFDATDVARLSDAARSRLRLRHIGFVFQRFFLLPMLTAAENVELPMSEAGVPKSARRARTRELLEYIGLSKRADHRPSQLSGGEMQRVAVARALANGPRLLLADEPTGELDEATGRQIAELLDRVNTDGTALVIVTHDSDLAGRARRLLTMRDGRIEQESTR